MRGGLPVLLIALTLLLLSSSEVSSARLATNDSSSKQLSHPLTAHHGQNPRFLRRDFQKNKATIVAEGNVFDEERGFASFVKSVFGVGKVESLNQDSKTKTFLTKMENMYRKGKTPQELKEIYGSNKKLTLQEDFRQYYKWRSSWGAEGRKYKIFRRPTR